MMKYLFISILKTKNSYTKDKVYALAFIDVELAKNKFFLTGFQEL